jgi:hypothetical protein
MFSRHVAAIGLALLSALAIGRAAEAAFGIGGVATKSINQNQAGFFITNSPGYSYDARLNGTPVPVGTNVVVATMDYHELSVWRTNLASSVTTNRLIQFIVIDAVRSGTEDGLAKWIPIPPILAATGELAGASLQIMAPPAYPQGLEIPVVAWLRNSNGLPIRVNGEVNLPSRDKFTVFRGAGSGYVAPLNTAGLLAGNATVAGLSVPMAIEVEPGTNWVRLGGTLSNANIWPENSRIFITNQLTIHTNATLSVGKGTVVVIGPGLDITLDGQLTLNGTVAAPIVLAPLNREQPWGGFIIQGNARLTASATIFSGAGRDQCWYGYHQADRCYTEGRPHSHRPEQSLFHCVNTPVVTLTDCAAIYLNGQFGHSVNSARFIMDRMLIQRCTTGGEYSTGTIVMRDSVMVEIPRASVDWVDADNDAFYINNGGNAFTNCVIGWTKDDCMDSGGGGSGTNSFVNCWFENPQHEGVAGSGSGKYNYIRGTVAIHCGQGFESGYDKVTNSVNNSLATGCIIGVRMADNYYSGFTHNGYAQSLNSLLLYNRRNVWGMEYNTTGWSHMTSQMDIRSNWLSEADSRWPANPVWNPATDAEKLLPFMTIPPDSHVGMALGVWTNTLPLAQRSDGIPVCLSHFTTNTVTVDFAVESVAGTLTNGTLVFPAGRVTHRISLDGLNVGGVAELTVRLSNPTQAEFTGLTSLTYRVPPVVISLAGSGAQADQGTLAVGVPITLSATSSVPVSVNYEFVDAAGTLTNGVLVFAPGEGTKRVYLPGLRGHNVIRLTLSQPGAGELGGAVQTYFVRLEGAAPTQLVATNSLWSYLDTGTNAGTVWREPAYNTTSWLSGQAQLGFGESDETTKIRLTNGISGYIVTHYFRQEFFVADPLSYTNLKFWILRDDGAAAYLNGREIYRSSSLPPAPTLLTHTTLADYNSAGTAENATEYLSISATNLVAGTNVLAVEVHQHDVGSSDVSFNGALTGEVRPPPLRAFLGRLDNGLVFYWADPGARLYSADQLTGPWLPAVLTNTPAVIPPAEARRFFHLRK